MTTGQIVGGVVLVIAIGVAIAYWRMQNDVMQPDASSPTPGGSTGEIATSPATGAGGRTSPLILRPMRTTATTAPKARTTDNNVIALSLQPRPRLRT